MYFYIKDAASLIFLNWTLFRENGHIISNTTGAPC